ncbi:MAG: ATP-dependent Clp protease ATP-binding subunit [Planctomycetaceae bacterium]|nr:ATP-dependent Clp protease ATP-binding subunit [Planctomycetaceae bacterium]
MSTVKYPIVWWQDLAGNFSVSTMSGVVAVGVDVDLTKAKSDLEKYLIWAHRQDPFEELPDLADLQTGWVDVTLRGQDTAKHERFPSEHTTLFRCQYAWGRRPDKSLRCVLPKLNRSFNCQQEALVKELVEESVRDSFSGRSLSTIIERLSYGELHVGWLHFRLPTAPQIPSSDHSQVALQSVAMPLSVRSRGKEFGNAWQRREEVAVVSKLLHDRQRNVLLVGPSGVGKTTILVEAVKTIDRDLANTRETERDSAEEIFQSLDSNGRNPVNVPLFWLTNASRLISGMQYLGQWEERCEKVVAELAEIRGVLCVENLLDLVLTGGQAPESSLAAFLQNFLTNRELRLVGEVTPRELETLRRLLPGFDNLFEIFAIHPLNESQSLEVLDVVANDYRRNHHFQIQPAALRTTWNLFRRFLPYDPFPGRCVKFWRRLLQDAVPLVGARDPGSKEVTISVEDVVTAFVNETGLPPWLIQDQELLPPTEIRSEFSKSIIGQPSACEAMTNLIATIKAAMNDPSRPFGVFLFCGPTGVGKTETALALSRYLFGSGRSTDRLIRLDMSEYGGFGAAQRLLTKANGEPAAWLERVRQQPFCVILLDEIEKAASEVFDVLMNVFDEGLMVDNVGRETNFRGSVIVLTSNLGSQAGIPIGFGEAGFDPFLKEVRRYFRPEFFNRLDAVVPFRSLSADSIRKIAEKEIQGLTQREGLRGRDLRITCSPAILDWLALHGYDHRFGARPLQRLIESQITTRLARPLAANPELKDAAIHFDLVDNEVSIVIQGIKAIDRE